MINKTFCVALVAGVLALPSQAAEFKQLVPAKSQVTFVFKQMGVPVTGSFGKFAAQVAFDPAKPETAKAQMDIDLSSIDAGGDEANEEVKSKNWFHVQQFPKASFVSSGVKALGGNKFELAGKLSIKGKTRDIVAPFTFTPQGPNGTFEGALAIKRLDYGIGTGTWGDVDTVADEVQIKFRLLIAAATAK
ncbi:MAG: YceI family protein [Rhodocyclaceae bacterium]